MHKKRDITGDIADGRGDWRKALKSLEQSVMPQGNKPGDDPAKFGLKFDGGKARWDLMPMKEVSEIIGVAQNNIDDPKYVNLTRFNEHNAFNQIMDMFSMYLEGLPSEDCIEHLSTIGFLLLYILRGKPYTNEELNRDDQPARWDLIDINEIQKVAEIYGYGAKKYAENNWKRVDKSRYAAAFMRHFKFVRTNDRFDSESGFLHIHHALWNIIALMWFEDKAASK